VANNNRMLAHALLEYFLSRKAAGVIRVSRASIPPPARVDHVVRDDFWGTIFENVETTQCVKVSRSQSDNIL
jgi:hypothetical protein